MHYNLPKPSGCATGYMSVIPRLPGNTIGGMGRSFRGVGMWGQGTKVSDVKPGGSVTAVANILDMNSLPGLREGLGGERVRTFFTRIGPCFG